MIAPTQRTPPAHCRGSTLALGKPMIRYAITDASTTHAPDAPSRLRDALLADARRWRDQGVDMIQLREKALPTGVLASLAHALMQTLEHPGPSVPQHRPLLLVNARADVAAAAGADGVHLTSQPDELTPAQVRIVFARAGRRRPTVAVSCHTLDDVQRARSAEADWIVFGPVFEKRVAGRLVQPGSGLARLAEACRAAAPVPVLALGGITAANTDACRAAGAQGIAGIRLFGAEYTCPPHSRPVPPRPSMRKWKRAGPC